MIHLLFFAIVDFVPNVSSMEAIDWYFDKIMTCTMEFTSIDEMLVHGSMHVYNSVFFVFNEA